MGDALREPTLLELVQAPVIDFDGFGEVVVLNGKCFWPLYQERPSLHGGVPERHLVAWAATRVENVPANIEKTAAALRFQIDIGTPTMVSPGIVLS